MNQQVIIINKKRLAEIIHKMSADGIENLHILADFDRTLTRAFAPDGSKVASLISILRDEGYLTSDYPTQAKKFFEHYHAIEVDAKISKSTKKKAMQEWWSKHFKLLIASRLNKRDVEKAVLSQRVQLRQGAEDFFKFLKDNNIPLVILSSSGLGGEAIRLYLKNKNLLFDNIYIVSNEFKWDKNGFATNIKQPIIHTLNKDETILKNFPFYNVIAERKNVILLGDSPSDVDMITGFDYKNLIKIGFWNKAGLKNATDYKKHYDVLIKNDGTMEKVNEIFKQIKGGKNEFIKRNKTDN